MALGPIGAGAKAQADIPSVTADFLTFAKAKGLYAGLNLEGAVIAVRDGMNTAYCGRDVNPADIVMKNDCSNKGADQLRKASKKSGLRRPFKRRFLKDRPKWVCLFFPTTINRVSDYSPFLITVTAVALKEAFTSFPSVNDSSSKE